MKPEDIKGIVREKYSAIAKQSNATENNDCCGTKGCCGQLEFSMIGDEYTNVEGHVAEADMGLGCGLPTAFAGIKTGDSVLDLGCGAGNDCFVSRSLTGESGFVTGIDFSEEMLIKANANLKKTGFKNISFVQGDIENLPLPGESYDVVISNCVLNLVPDKEKAFSEIFRVLRPGGHFCISDVVLSGNLPEGLRNAAELYAGCVSGALMKDEYLDIVRKQGFTSLKIHKEKAIQLPEAVVSPYLRAEEVEKFHSTETGIFSITLTATKE